MLEGGAGGESSDDGIKTQGLEVCAVYWGLAVWAAWWGGGCGRSGWAGTGSMRVRRSAGDAEVGKADAAEAGKV